MSLSLLTISRQTPNNQENDILSVLTSQAKVYPSRPHLHFSIARWLRAQALDFRFVPLALTLTI